jgi:hypothetical protein
MLNCGKHFLDRVSPLSAAIFAAIVASLVRVTIGYVMFAPQSPRSVPVTTTSPAVTLPPPVEVASPAPLATVEAKPKRYVIGNANNSFTACRILAIGMSSQRRCARPVDRQLTS